MKLAWVLPSLLLLAACGEQAPPAGAAPLAGQVFLSDEVTVAGKPHALAPRTRVSLEFTDDGRLIATAGCNTMSGPVRTSEGRLEVDDLVVTELGCDPERHAQDEWLARILGAGPEWRRHGSGLTVTAGDTELVLSRRADRTLEHTTWRLDTIIDGQTASSVPDGAATLVFDGKRVEADTGCNGAGGEYTRSGDTIDVRPGARTLMACSPDIMAMESAVDAVLRGEVTVELDGDRLTLTNSSGKGIQLHAQ